MKASTTISLDLQVVQFIGEIRKSEVPNDCPSWSTFNTGTEKSENKLSTILYCRAYRLFIKLTAIREFTMFIHPKMSEKSKPILSYIRCRKSAPSNIYLTTVKHASVTQQFKMVVNSRGEQNKLLNFLRCPHRPLRSPLLNVIFWDAQFFIRRSPITQTEGFCNG